MNLTEALKYTILRTKAGSEAYGLSLEGGSDEDQMGVCIEPLSEHLVLGEAFEQFIHRDAAFREGKHDAPSGPGDLDLKIYSLAKFCRLAAAGNPSVIDLLFIPHEFHVQCDARGHQLQEMAPMFLSKECIPRFLGYLHGQRQRLLGLQGQKRIKRPELEEKHGYDTKYAMHMVRLGVHGLELVQTGKLSVPVQPAWRHVLMEIRQGKLPLQEVLGYVGNLEKQIRDGAADCCLPDHPDRTGIETWLRKVYFRNWSAMMPHLRSTDEGLKEYVPGLGA